MTNTGRTGTSLPEKEGFLYKRKRGLYKRGVNISVNSKTSNLPLGIPQGFDWSFALYDCVACENNHNAFFLATCLCMETLILQGELL